LFLSDRPTPYTEDLTPPAAALARYARRGITLCPLPDGAVHIKGLADEVTGAVLLTGIDAANPPVTSWSGNPVPMRSA